MDLVGFMMAKDPGNRPEMALEEWRVIKAGLSVSMVRCRLCKTKESVGERVVLDVSALVRQGLHSMTQLS